MWVCKSSRHDSIPARWGPWQIGSDDGAAVTSRFPQAPPTSPDGQVSPPPPDPWRDRSAAAWLAMHSWARWLVNAVVQCVRMMAAPSSRPLATAHPTCRVRSGGAMSSRSPKTRYRRPARSIGGGAQKRPWQSASVPRHRSGPTTTWTLISRTAHALILLLLLLHPTYLGT